MEYVLYKTDDGKRMLAFGEFLPFLNIHRIETSGLVQTSSLLEEEPTEVDEQGELTLEEIEERFGAVVPLSESEDIAALEKSIRRRAAAERLGGPVDFVTVHDEVIAVRTMSIEDLQAQLPLIEARQNALPPYKRERYDHFLRMDMSLYDEPSLRQWVESALMAFASMEHAIEKYG